MPSNSGKSDETSRTPLPSPTKAEIYQLVHDLVGEGKGVLLVSSDLPELLGMADRILVMFRGELVKELIVTDETGKKRDDINEDTILFWATGGRETV